MKDSGPKCLASPHPVAELARAAEVDNLDSAALGVAEENILGLEVAVNDAELGCGQKEQCCAQLLGKLSCQVERDAAEVGVPQQVVEVVREEFKDETQVVSEHKVPPQLHCKHNTTRTCLPVA